MTQSSRILFIHHSVGRGILRHGHVRDHLRRKGDIELWDHDYNRRGLTGPDGRRTGDSFPIPDDNTDPPGLLKLFDEALRQPTLGQRLAGYDLVLVKSCFPNSRIESDQRLAELQEIYTAIAKTARRAVDGARIGVVTTPPVRVGRIKSDDARRAASLASWLVDSGPFEVTFDLFGALADLELSSDGFGMLRREFTNPFLVDSHPTRRASEGVGEPFAAFLTAAVG